MEKDVVFFEAYLIHKNEKNKRGTRRKRNMNPKTRGSECADALWVNKMTHDHYDLRKSKVTAIKTHNGKEIRGFRVIHQLYLESIQEILETKKQELEDECNFFDRDFNFDSERNDDWRDYATEENRRHMEEMQKYDFNLDCFCDSDFDYEDYPEEEFFG